MKVTFPSEYRIHSDNLLLQIHLLCGFSIYVTAINCLIILKKHVVMERKGKNKAYKIK